ncbi:MAG: cytochrome b5 domain-containing protein [Candidatus Diapherotrites archaeon]|uniref:Cytochrome b5 domain-containing protein n=1 Tax=Candidatus Iainarchaeum sp. TaxID=3101447 RepID=A0A8T4C7H1_9ARCH|nr:cytochrome b5 domain-containing protein [Candidatus Diapherotrites archaeon]
MRAIIFVLLLLIGASGCIVSVDPRALDETVNVPVENTPVENPPVVNPPVVVPPTTPPVDTNLVTPPVAPPVTPPPTVPATILLSKTQVAAYSAKKDCWVIYSGSVYNVSSYTSHPGGNVYVPYCGKDMTKAFNQQGHSTKADKILSGFLLGKVGETIPASSV